MRVVRTRLTFLSDKDKYGKQWCLYLFLGLIRTAAGIHMYCTLPKQRFQKFSYCTVLLRRYFDVEVFLIMTLALMFNGSVFKSGHLRA